MNSARAFERKSVLVTGGLGFIGSNLAIRLAEAGAKVTVIDSSVAGCGANPFNLAPVASKVDVVDEDIGDTAAFESILRETQIIFNLAGEISHSRSMADPERDLRLNTLPQLRFLQACRAHCPGARIVYASTRQVYGKPEYLPADEQHPIQPIDFNGVHKYAATQYHLLLARRGDLDCAVLRLSNVYGPRMALHLPQQGFLGVYLQRALNRETLDLYGDGSQLRDPIHVDDAVDAFLRAGAAPSLRFRVFNVGGPEPLSLRRIAEIVAGESGGSMIRQLPFPEHLLRIDIGSYVSDTTRIRCELGSTPQIAFPEGICASLAYYRKYGNEYLAMTDRVTELRAVPAMVSESLVT
jgi:UDP-glucose 4-epimerase